MSNIINLIEEILIPLMAAGVIIICAITLKNRKAQILATVNDLIQKAENAIRSSGMGEKKKEIVIKQLEAIGISVTPWLSKQIDIIVQYLNDNEAWLIDTATDAISNELSKLVTIASSNTKLLNTSTTSDTVDTTATKASVKSTKKTTQK